MQQENTLVNPGSQISLVLTEVNTITKQAVDMERLCTAHYVVRVSNSLGKFVPQILLFPNSQNNVGRKKTSHLQ